MSKPISLAEKAREKVDLNESPIGTSGTAIYSGYFSEDYLSELRGNRGSDMYDKMRRIETQIQMVLSAVKNPILSSKWEIQAGGDQSKDLEIKEFVESQVLGGGLGQKWRGLLQEILSFIEFGFSIFERTHDVRQSKRFGKFTGVRLNFRSQRTIEEWTVKEKTGELISVSQIADGDLSVDDIMDARFLTLFSIQKEGSNYEGISLLRPCYGAYKRKLMFLKLMAIGTEHRAIPFPVGKVPDDVRKGDPDFVAFETALQQMAAHEKTSIIIPKSYEIEFVNSDFDPSKLIESLGYEDRNMVKAFLANFLELGASSSSGSWSLSTDQSDFFLSGIQNIADLVVENMNDVIKELVILNYGPQDYYPELMYSGLTDKAGAEWATIYRELVASKIITPDDRLEEHARKRIGAPERDEETSRDTTPAPQAPFGQSEKKPCSHKLSESYKFADTKPSRLIKTERDRLRETMTAGLKVIADDMISQIMKAYKSLPDSRKVDAVLGIDPRGLSKYRQALLSDLGGASLRSLDGVKQEVPIDVNFSDHDGSIEFAEDDPNSKLPSNLRKKNKIRAANLSETQAADLKKMVIFQFGSAVDSTDSADQIAFDMTETADKYIEGGSVQTAAANAAAFQVNEARNFFFYTPEVLNEIESMTFTNFDPQSDICKDLAGRVFDPNDPAVRRFITPLHHNCESFWRANLKGMKNPPALSPDGLNPSDPKLLDQITLKEK